MAALKKKKKIKKANPQTKFNLTKIKCQVSSVLHLLPIVKLPFGFLFLPVSKHPALIQ